MLDSNNNEVAMTTDQKLNVLLHALEERYKSIHIIRDRVQNISVWILGLFVTAGGWLIQSNTSLMIKEKWFSTIIIIISVLVVRIFYLKDLEKGFKAQQRIQAKIEDALDLCKVGVFTQDSIYPKEWTEAGSKGGNGKFFFHNYLLIYIGTGILLLSIWLR